MNKLLVIADDLTGALDTGVQFSKKGISALVLTAERLSCDDASLKDAGGPEIDVLVVDTEPRHRPAEQAGDVIVRLVACAFAPGFRYF